MITKSEIINPTKNKSISDRLKVVGRPRSNKQLSIRERLFIKDLFSRAQGDPVKAVAMNYSVKDKQNAKAQSKKLMKNLRVKQAVQVMFEKAGISKEHLGKIIAEGLKAKMPITFKGIITTKYPNYEVRHRYLATALELLDFYPSKKIEAEIHSIPEDRKAQLITLLTQVITADTVNRDSNESSRPKRILR